jgi:multiple sugar transport system permease protein
MIKTLKATWESHLKRRQAILAFLFLSPWVVGFIIFGLYPMGMSFYYSLCRYDVLRVPQFIGWQNYKDLFFQDPYFWQSIWNTLYYTALRTPLSIAGSLLLAVLVNNALKGVRLFRTVYFIPSIVTGVALSVLWMWMLNPQYGLVNNILAFFAIPGPLWLKSPEWSKPAMVLMGLWSIGGGRMLVFLAALQGIPRALYESVEIDGGGWWSKFYHVTLTLFYNLYLYFKAFDDYSMGYASAMAWILLLITLLITLIQFKLGKRWVHYDQ